MITVMELQFDSWEHTGFNAGLLQLLSLHNKDKVRLIASANHLNCIRNIIDLDGIELHTVVLPNKRKVDRIEYLEEYRTFVKSIVDSIGIYKNDIFIILSSPKNVMCSVSAVLKEKTKLYFCQHANLDWVLHREMEQTGEYSYADIMNRCAKSEGTSFIVCNPFAGVKLKKYLDFDVTKKFIFLHHPVVEGVEPINGSDEGYIGAYGQSLKGDFSSVLREFLNFDRNLADSFIVFRNTDVDHLDYTFSVPKGFKIHQKIGGYTMKEIYEFQSKMKWILLPYSESMYEVSMSGILADAIRCSIPIIGLGSPILKYYNQYAIGIVEDNPSQLVEKYRTVSHKEYNMFKNNLIKLRKKMIEDNMSILDSIMHGVN